MARLPCIFNSRVTDILAMPGSCASEFMALTYWSHYIQVSVSHQLFWHNMTELENDHHCQMVQKEVIITEKRLTVNTFATGDMQHIEQVQR